MKTTQRSLLEHFPPVSPRPAVFLDEGLEDQSPNKQLAVELNPWHILLLSPELTLPPNEPGILMTSKELQKWSNKPQSANIPKYSVTELPSEGEDFGSVVFYYEV